jgi:putative ABC transport system permease protein
MNGAYRLAWRNLRRNRRRNAATGAAIALGFAALLALTGYLNRVQNYLRVYTVYAARTGHIVIYRKDGLTRFSLKPRDYSLTPADQTAIRRALEGLENVELHGPTLLGVGLVGNGCRTLPFMASGIDPQVDRALRTHPELKRWAPQLSDYDKGRGLWAYPESLGAIAVARGLARLLAKPKVYDDLPEGQKLAPVVDCLAPNAKDVIGADANVQLAAGTWRGMMGALDGEIVAQYNTGVTETNNVGILTSRAHLAKLYETDDVTYWSVWLRDPEALDATRSMLLARLGAAAERLDVYRWDTDDIAPFYTGTLDFLRTMIAFLACVLGSVVAFSVFNATTMTVIERAQEIGMMRALGFTRRTVFGLFVKEAVLLAGFALVAGALVAVVGLSAINAAEIRLYPPGVAGGILLKLVPSPVLTLASAVGVFGLALATTVAAVSSVARRNIAALLMGNQR